MLPSGAAAASADSAALLVLLRSLAEQLQHGDMAATETIVELQDRFGGALGTRLQALDAAIGVLDFTQALQQCDTLAAQVTEALAT